MVEATRVLSGSLLSADVTNTIAVLIFYKINAYVSIPIPKNGCQYKIFMIKIKY